MSGFDLMNGHKFELNVTPGSAATYALLSKGIKNAAPSNNEKLAQDNYMDGAGFGSTDVIGAQLILSFTGDRYYGDQAQDFIMGLLLNVGSGRKTDFRWTEPNGGVFTGGCTIANIDGPTGDAGAKGEIKFEIHFNGKPTYTPSTGDVTAPTVTVTPADNATGVVATANVVWLFSEAIQDATVTNANFFVMKASDGTEVTGTLTLSGDKKTVTFAHGTAFAAATAYIATATKDVKDVAGNSLAANNIVNFTTA
jgi:hypothetical protein